MQKTRPSPLVVSINMRGISHLKGDSAVYLDRNVWLSADAQQLTITQARISDGGRYTCKATVRLFLLFPKMKFATI